MINEMSESKTSKRSNEMSEMSEMEGSRVCIHQSREELPSFRVERQEITTYDAIEVCLRIAHFLRNRDNGINQVDRIIDSFEIHEKEPTDDPRVCVAWNPNSKQIQVSILGMDVWEACLACNNAVALLQSLVFDPTGITED
jgi:hypothetical protein